MKLNAKELRDLKKKEAEGVLKKIKRRPIFFILENIYDTYNIGGIFRLADALAVKKIYICGETETPPNTRIKKASIGTYKVVPWIYKKTAREAIKELRDKVSGIKIFAIEQDKKSVNYQEVKTELPIALMVGNESYGTLTETLKLVDKIVEIPMWGINKSLNVIVSLTIVSYYYTSRC